MSGKIRHYGVVKSTEHLSRDMRRIVLHGGTLESFPDVKPGAYIKLLFDAKGRPVLPEYLNTAELSMRTYTVRHFDPVTSALTIDFVLHGDDEHSGPASGWARTAKPGDQLCFAGPGRSKPLIDGFDSVIFAGDLTALPTIESYLAELPGDAKGVAVIAANDVGNVRSLRKPDGVELIWLTEPHSSLASALALLPKPRARVAIWAASEFTQMREMRHLFTTVWQVPRSDVYISSYWKQGRSEDQHKLDKRRDAEAQKAA